MNVGRVPMSWRALRSRVLVLTVLSGLTVFVDLGRPAEVVFDEVYFAEFASSYCCTGQRIFDVHPPHGKLLVAGVAGLLGFRARGDYSAIGNAYPPGESLQLRALPAVAGLLVPLVVFWLLVRWGASLAGATFGALLVIFDNALTLQSRLLTLDSMLVLFTFAGLLFYGEARATTGKVQYVWLVLCGICVGLAPGIKYTGLLAPGMVGLLFLVDVFRASQARTRRTLRQLMPAGLIVAPALLVYGLGWWLHFHLLTEPGPGDIWGRWSGRFWTDFVSVQQTMLSANNGLHASHQDGSVWWEWPLMLRPIYYWSSGPRKIYLVGNPLVWWGTSLMLLVMPAVALLRATTASALGTARRSHVRLQMPLLGFVASYAPLIFVDRSLFLYHYLTPLVFASMASVLWLDRAGWFTEDSMWRQRFRVHVLIGLLLTGFVLMAPLTYGTSWGQGWRERLLTSLPLWR